MSVLTDLVAAVQQLRSDGAPDRPKRHQALLLLWAIGRARRGVDRLVRWLLVQSELVEGSGRS